MVQLNRAVIRAFRSKNLLNSPTEPVLKQLMQSINTLQIV